MGTPTTGIESAVSTISLFWLVIKLIFALGLTGGLIYFFLFILTKGKRKEVAMDTTHFPEQDNVKRFSPSLFIIILICFFLPFIDISCSGHKVISFTGIQMVTGTTIQQPSMFGNETKSEKVNPEPLAIITLVCVIIGLILSFIKNRKSAILPVISAGIGTATLLMLKAKIDNQILLVGGGALQVEYDIGYWSILLLFIAAIGVNMFIFLAGRDVNGIALKSPSQLSFCSQCGAKVSPDDAFCSECGYTLK